MLVLAGVLAFARRLSSASRRLIAWGVVSLPLALAAAILAPRLEAWWIYALVAGAPMAVTPRLAQRADSPSIPEP